MYKNVKYWSICKKAITNEFLFKRVWRGLNHWKILWQIRFEFNVRDVLGNDILMIIKYAWVVWSIFNRLDRNRIEYSVYLNITMVSYVPEKVLNISWWIFIADNAFVCFSIVKNFEVFFQIFTIWEFFIMFFTGIHLNFNFKLGKICFQNRKTYWNGGETWYRQHFNPKLWRKHYHNIDQITTQQSPKLFNAHGYKKNLAEAIVHIYPSLKDVNNTSVI